MPVPTVQVLLDDGTGTWQHDVTGYARMVDGITINRGRQDEFTDVQPSVCNLTLDNTDGFFTPVVDATPNLVGNGSFERDAAGWSATGGTVARSGSVGYYGTSSLAVTCSGGTAKVSSHRIPVSPGVSYGVTGVIRTAVTGRSVDFGLEWFDDLGNSLEGTAGAVVAAGTDSTSWGLYWGNVVAPAAADTCIVRMKVYGAAAAEVHHLDGVYVTPGTVTSGTVYKAPAVPTKVNTGLRVKVTGNGVTTTRFTGNITTWPTSWPSGGETFAVMQVSAVDRLARLARRKLRSVLENEVLALKPAGYYLLNEPSGALAAGDTSGRGLGALAVTQKGTGGTLEFGAGTGPGTDGMTAAVFTRATPQLDGMYLSGPVSQVRGASRAWWIRAAFSTSTTSGGEQTLFAGYIGSSLYVKLTVNGLGKVECLSVAGGTVVTGSTTVTDGLVHDAVAVSDDAAGTLSVYVDGVLDGSVAFTGNGGPCAAKTITIGGGPGTSGLMDGAVSHVAFGAGAPTAGDIAAMRTAGVDGFVADSSDDRVARYAKYARIPVSEQALEPGLLSSVAHLDTTGMSPVAAMQRVATSEQGLLFVDGSGVLTFHARDHRYGPALVQSFDTSHDDVAADTSFVRDTQGLINTVTATRPGGANQAYTVAASVRAHEEFPSSLDLLVTTDGDALSAAQWVANTHSEPLNRLPALTVDLLTGNGAFASGAQAIELGDAVAMSNLPSQVGTSVASVFVEGWQETISADSWTLTFNTSPLVTVWTIEDPVSGFTDSTFRVAY